MTSAQKTAYRRNGSVGKLQLVGYVDINTAGDLHELACRALADTKAQTVCVELAQADRLDVTALQILCALARDLRADDRSFQVEEMQPAVADEVAALGISL